MNEQELIQALKSFRSFTKSRFGKNAATLALKKIKGGYAVGLTEDEKFSIREHRKHNRKFPKPKRLWPFSVSAYDEHCPYCQRNIWGNVNIVRVLRETPDIDLVSLICKCGTVFRKFEDKREGMTC